MSGWGASGMQDAAEGAARARPRDDIARVERDDAGHFSGFACFVELPLSEDVNSLYFPINSSFKRTPQAHFSITCHKI